MAKKGLFDRNTLIIIGFVVLVALSVIIFKIITTKKCPEVKFSIVNTDAIKAGDLVAFSDNTPDAETWDWDFGDGTPHETTKDPSHLFAKAGEYTVILNVNGCSDPSQQIVTVAPDVIPLLDTILPIGGIKGPDGGKIRVGSAVKFSDTTNVGTSWDWRFGETGQTDATEKEATYVFKQPGKHTVSLIINGKSQMATMEVMVLPNAPVGSAAPKQAIGETEFLVMLQTIISHKESSAHIFDKCMCNYINMPVKVNGVDKQFDSYINSLYLTGTSLKNIKVKLTSDKGCVTGVVITQEKTEEE